MKRFLLLTLCAALSVAVTAQAFEPDYKKLMEAYPSLQKPGTMPNLDVQALAPPLQWNRNVKTPPGVYTLPQDRMPCLVPDTEAIAAMPNVVPKMPTLQLPQPGQIPNAAPRSKKRPEPNGDVR